MTFWLLGFNFQKLFFLVKILSLEIELQNFVWQKLKFQKLSKIKFDTRIFFCVSNFILQLDSIKLKMNIFNNLPTNIKW
jgi:hypothetical protein